MKLQTLLFPKENDCQMEEMYYRKNHQVIYMPRDNMLKFDKAGKITLDTYFNSFSVEKWLKYTKLNNLVLEIEFKGNFKATLINRYYDKGKIFSKKMSASCFKSKNLAKVNLKFDVQNNFTGIYYIKLEALQDDSYLVGGQYKMCCNQLADVHIGLVICTYKREKFIENNLQLLKQNILCNIDSPLCNNLHIFISDNGQTLDIDGLSMNKIHIFSNKNTGGSGGFTRGLVEIINNESSLPITHVLLMDDDVEIETESLVRTFNFLRLVKDEFYQIDTF